METAFQRGPAISGSGSPSAAGTKRTGIGGTASDSHDSSFLEPIERVFSSLRRMASNYGTLAIVDLRRASVQLAWLVGAGIVAAVLVVTAWLAGVVALGVVLLGNGMSWPAVLGVAALLNLVGAALVAWGVKHIFDEAPFAATLKQIRSADSAESDAA